MKKYLLFIFLAFIVKIYAQEAKFITVKNAKIDSTLKVGADPFFESPIYLITKDHLIFQKDTHTRKILTADIQSLRRPKYDGSRLFILDKNGVFFNGIQVKIDTTGFVILGKTPKNDILWKTNKAVYKNTLILSNIKGSDFVRVPDHQGNFYEGYFKDKTHVYYYDLKLKGLNAAEALTGGSGSICHDKNIMYMADKQLFFQNQPLQYVNEYLNKTKDFAVYQDNIAPEIDPVSLKPLSRSYSVDQNHAYYGNEILPIEKADFASLKVWDHTNSSYLTDGKKLFYKNREIVDQDFDLPSFGTFGIADYCYDKNGIYTRFWDKDKNKVIYKKFPFKYSDPVNSTNTFISDGSSMYVFYKDQAYSESGNELFENLTQEQINLAKPLKMLLFNENGITKLSKGYDYLIRKVDDKIYWGQKDIGADGETFDMIGGFYNFYKDRNNVYQYSREEGFIPVKGIDVPSTEAFMGFLSDKDYIYINHQRIMKNKDPELVVVFQQYGEECGTGRSSVRRFAESYFLFKNREGYWMVKTGDTVYVNKIDEKDINLKKLLEDRIPKTVSKAKRK